MTTKKTESVVSNCEYRTKLPTGKTLGYTLSSKKQSWTFGKKDPCIVFWDSLGNEPKTYKRLYTRIMNMYKKVLVFNHPLQSHFSNCCGLYCLVLAHHLPICENFETIAKTIPKRMVDEHILVRFVNYHYKTDYSFLTI